MCGCDGFEWLLRDLIRRGYRLGGPMVPDGATVVGRVESGEPAVRVRTSLGVTRPLLLLAGHQFPRIY